VYCFKEIELKDGKLPFDVRIEGGVRIRNIKVEWAQRADNILEENLSNEELKVVGEVAREKTVVIRPNSDGDFSTYTLRLVHLKKQELPPEGFDRIFSQTDLHFKVECPSEFDCLPQRIFPPESFEEPSIDYMAKDYASFRRLMLDRLSTLIPDWRETHPADLGVSLVELLAYVGDHLSYYQDAVATEAYLGTARRRVSVKRHARLLDYLMHEGCNARAWVCMEVDREGLQVPKGTKLLTSMAEVDPVVKQDQYEEARKGAEIFETMHDAVLYKRNNRIEFYTWGESRCCLPIGTTNATLSNEGNSLNLTAFTWENVPGGDSESLKKFLVERFGHAGMEWIKEQSVEFSKNNDREITCSDGVHSLSIKLDADKTRAPLTIDGEWVDEFIVEKKNSVMKLNALSLKVGDALVFEELRSPESGRKSEADPSHRIAVRLSKVKAGTCELNNIPIVDIAWKPEDAITFPLVLGEVIDPTASMHADQVKKPISVAHGNVVLADHGNTVSAELGSVPEKGHFCLRLPHKNLTYAASFDASLPASSAFDYDVRDADPAIGRDAHPVKGEEETWELPVKGEEETWEVKRDLLASDKFSPHFVVETDNDGTAHIRFGDNVHGRRPRKSTAADRNTFSATYRIGSGRRGNVGSNTITRIVNSEKFSAEGITRVWNPMEASGGREPEDIEEVRQYAPWAFRTQERAVTVDDYAEVLKRHPDVQKAAAVLRWTGSWYTIFVMIDRKGGKELDEEFKTEIRRLLNKYRLAGYDFEINEPTYVPLDLKAKVCATPDYLPSEVKKALLEVFSNRDLPEAERGFFHPDNFTFGQPVYLSRLYETAMEVDGVTSVVFERFQRWGKPDSDELKDGLIKMESFEIARLDNDPNFPENGKIEFVVEGGR